MRVIGAAAALSVGLCAPAVGAAPAPCAGVVQISDDTGDGHHDNTDVLSAWFSEQAGRLQAVIKVARGDWRPMHVDADAAGWAVLFEVAGQTRFVRAEAPKGAPIRYDHGTWTLAGGFLSAGPATGEVTAGPGATATIDVPAETGTLFARPFVLTYEHEPAAAAAHWVDRAPGGVTPTEAAFGADYVVGSCQPSAPAAPVATGGNVPGAGGAATTGVVLNAPKRLVGGGAARARGRIVPARAGVTVVVTATARRSSRPPLVRSVATLADGSFAVSVPLSESSTITAVAEGINAQTRTITVQSTVRLTLRRLANGKTSASGRVRPGLPGRVLLLRTDAAVPTATTTVRRGRFRFRFPARRLLRGRYQAVFIPSRNRAERSTSPSGVIR